jgi:Tfp pilus assembly protein PilO
MEEKEIKNQQKEEIQFFALSIVFSLMIILIGLFFILRPMVDNISSNQVELKNLEAEAKYLEDKLQIIKDLEGKFESLKQVRVLAEAAIPNNSAEENLLVQIQNIGSVSGVIINSFKKEEAPLAIASDNFERSGENQMGNFQQFSPQAPAAQQSVSLATYSFSLEIQGKYSGIKSFLANLENNIRPIFINSVNIQRMAGASETVQATISGKTYYFK